MNDQEREGLWGAIHDWHVALTSEDLAAAERRIERAVLAIATHHKEAERKRCGKIVGVHDSPHTDRCVLCRIKSGV